MQDTFSLYPSEFWITSGAIQNGVPTNVCQFYIISKCSTNSCIITLNYHRGELHIIKLDLQLSWDHVWDKIINIFEHWNHKTWKTCTKLCDVVQLKVHKATAIRVEKWMESLFKENSNSSNNKHYRWWRKKHDTEPGVSLA